MQALFDTLIIHTFLTKSLFNLHHNFPILDPGACHAWRIECDANLTETINQN